MRHLKLAAFIVLLGASVFPLRASSIFIDGDVPDGTITPFVDTNDGITATFSGASFAFAGEAQGGYILGGALATYPDSDLDIAFSVPLSSISFYYNAGSLGPFTISGYLDGNYVGGTSVVYNIFNPPIEMLFSLSDVTLNYVALTSSGENDGFEILDVEVDRASSIPEPDCIVLMLSGTLGISLLSLARGKRS